MMLMMLVTAPCFALVEILACSCYYMQARTRSRGARSHYSWPALIIEALLPPGDSRVTGLPLAVLSAGTSEMSLRLQNSKGGEHLNSYAIRSSSKNKQRQKRLGRFRILLQ